MKTSRSITYVLALFIISLISCGAIKNSTKSPTSRLISAINKGQNFYAKGETFDGDILLETIFNKQTKHSTYIDSELVFEGCTFNGKLTLKPIEGKSLYFNKEVIFEGCEFTKDFIINDAVFNARLQIGGSLLKRSLDLQRNSYKHSCRIDENEVGQDLILQYSKFQDNLSLFGNTLGRHLSMQGISVLGKSQLGNTSLNGSIDISSSHFHEDFNLDYAKKGKKLLAGNSKFYSTCYIRSLEDFTIVDLSSCELFGKYIFTAKHDVIPNMDKTNLHRPNQ